MRVALFITCFNDLLFPDVGKATVALLRRLGHEVEFPDAQTCCGQMHFNTGYRDACVPLVRRFAETFAGFDAVVTPSASCAAMVRHHHATVAEESGDAGAARRRRGGRAAGQRAERVPRRRPRASMDVGARFPHAVAFHPTCHSLRLLRIGDRPQRLLASVEGLTLVDLPGADECCGFGGTFAVKNADTSVAMGDDKVDALVATGAEVLTSADTSCLMHLGGLLSRRGSPIRVMHLAEILAAGADA